MVDQKPPKNPSKYKELVSALIDREKAGCGEGYSKAEMDFIQAANDAALSPDQMDEVINIMYGEDEPSIDDLNEMSRKYDDCIYEEQKTTDNKFVPTITTDGMVEREYIDSLIKQVVGSSITIERIDNQNWFILRAFDGNRLLVSLKGDANAYGVCYLNSGLFIKLKQKT